MTESGRLCAFITKVKRGSLADTVGRLRPGTLDAHTGAPRSCSSPVLSEQPSGFRGSGSGVERPPSSRRDV